MATKTIAPRKKKNAKRNSIVESTSKKKQLSADLSKPYSSSECTSGKTQKKRLIKLLQESIALDAIGAEIEKVN